MENELENKIYEFCNGFKRISTTLIMMKFKLKYESANYFYCKILLRNHNEARELAKIFEAEFLNGV
jgi:hypothetical protein